MDNIKTKKNKSRIISIIAIVILSMIVGYNYGITLGFIIGMLYGDNLMTKIKCQYHLEGAIKVLTTVKEGTDNLVELMKLSVDGINNIKSKSKLTEDDLSKLNNIIKQIEDEKNRINLESNRDMDR